MSLCPDIKRLREHHEMLRSFGSFIYHPLLTAISTLLEDADSMSAFRHGLHTLQGTQWTNPPRHS